MSGLIRIIRAALAHALRLAASAGAGSLNAWADRLDPPPVKSPADDLNTPEQRGEQ